MPPAEKQHRHIGFYEALESLRVNSYGSFLDDAFQGELETTGPQNEGKVIPIQSGDLLDAISTTAVNTDFLVSQNSLAAELKETYTSKVLDHLFHNVKSPEFREFHNSLRPYVTNLPLLIAVADGPILDLVVGYLDKESDLDPCFSVCLSLLRDLGNQLPMKFVMHTLTSLSKVCQSSSKGVFEVLARLLYMGRNLIIENFNQFSDVFIPRMLLHQKHHVRVFSAESLAYCIRHLDNSDKASLNDIITSIIVTCTKCIVASDIDQYARYAVESISTLLAECVKNVNHAIFYKKLVNHLNLLDNLADEHREMFPSDIDSTKLLVAIGLATIVMVKRHVHDLLLSDFKKFMQLYFKEGTVGNSFKFRIAVATIADRPLLTNIFSSECDAVTPAAQSHLSWIAKSISHQCEDMRVYAILAIESLLNPQAFSAWLETIPSIREAKAISDTPTLLNVSKGESRNWQMLCYRLLGCDEIDRNHCGNFLDVRLTCPTHPELIPQIITFLLSRMKNGLFAREELHLLRRAIILASEVSSDIKELAAEAVSVSITDDHCKLLVTQIALILNIGVATQTTITSPVIEDRILQWENLHIALSSFDDLEKAYSDVLPLLIGDDMRLRVLSLWQSKGLVDSLEATDAACFVQMLRSSKVVSWVSPLVSKHQRLLGMLLEFSGCPQLGLRSHALCLLNNVLTEYVVEESPKKKIRTEDGPMNKLPLTPETILSLCQELNDTANTFDSAASKQYTITRLGQMGERLLGAKDEAICSISIEGYGSIRDLLIRIVTDQLILQNSQRFSPLWKSAASQLVKMYFKGDHNLVLETIENQMKIGFIRWASCSKLDGSSSMIKSPTKRIRNRIQADLMLGDQEGEAIVSFKETRSMVENRLTHGVIDLWCHQLKEAPLSNEDIEAIISQLANEINECPPATVVSNFLNCLDVIADAADSSSKYRQFRSGSILLDELLVILTEVLYIYKFSPDAPPTAVLPIELHDVLDQVTKQADKFDVIQRLLKCIHHLGPVKNKFLQDNTALLSKLENVCWILHSKLYSYWCPEVQTQFINTFHTIVSSHDKIALPPSLSKYVSLTDSATEILNKILLSGKQMRHKMREYSEQLLELKETDVELICSILCQVVFSRLNSHAFKTQKDFDKNAFLSVLMLLPGTPHLFFALMLQTVYESTSLHSIHQLVKEACRSSAICISPDMSILVDGKVITSPVLSRNEHQDVMDEAMDEETSPETEENYPQGNSSRRLAGFLRMMKSLNEASYKEFRDQGLLRLTCQLLGRLFTILEMNPPDCFTRKERTLLSRLVMEHTISIFETYANDQETLRFFLSLISRPLKDHLRRSLSLEHRTKSNVSWSVRFVLGCLKSRDLLWVLAEDSAWLSPLLRSMTKNHCSLDLITHVADHIRDLWDYGTNTDSRSIRAELDAARTQRMQKLARIRHAKNQGEMMEDSSDSDEDGVLELNATKGRIGQTEEELALRATATKLIETNVNDIVSLFDSLFSHSIETYGSKALKKLRNYIDLLCNMTATIDTEGIAAKQLIDIMCMLLSMMPAKLNKPSQTTLSTIGLVAETVINLLCRIDKTEEGFGQRKSVYGSVHDTTASLAGVLSLSANKMNTLLMDPQFEASREICGLLNLVAVVKYHTSTDVKAFTAAVNKSDHPARLISVNPECDLIVDSLLGLLGPVSSLIGLWDIVFAYIIYCINVRGISTSLLTSDGDPDVQLSILSSINVLGLSARSISNTFVDALKKAFPKLTKKLAQQDNTWDMHWQKRLCSHFMALETSARLDFSMTSSLSRFWNEIFSCCQLTGFCKQAFTHLLRTTKEPRLKMRVQDATSVQLLWKRTAEFVVYLKEHIFGVVYRTIQSDKRRLQVTGLEMLKRINLYVTSVSAYLSDDPSSDFFATELRGLQQEEWLHHDLLSFSTYEVLDNATLPSIDSKSHFSLIDSVEEAQRKLQRHPLQDKPYIITNDYSVLTELASLQKDTRRTAFELLREQIDLLSTYTINKFILPLAFKEVVQKASFDGDVMNRGLSDEASKTLAAALSRVDFVLIISYIKQYNEALKELNGNGGDREAFLVSGLSKLSTVIVKRYNELKCEEVNRTTGCSSPEAEAEEDRLAKIDSTIVKTVIPIFQSAAFPISTPSNQPKRKADSAPMIRPLMVGGLLHVVKCLPSTERRRFSYKILGSIAKCLMSKEIEDRRKARHALYFHLRTLGIADLPSLITELKSRMNKGVGSCSLMLTMEYVLRGLSKDPLDAERNAIQRAVSACVDIIQPMITSELDRLANATETTNYEDTEARARLDESHKKKLDPEMTRFCSANVAHYMTKLLPGPPAERFIRNLSSLLEPGSILRHKAQLQTGTFSSRYLTRCLQIIEAALKGLEASPILSSTNKLSIIQNQWKTICITLIKEGDRQETFTDFALVRKVFSSDLDNEAFQLGQPSTSKSQSRELSARDEYFAIQPGAATGQAIERTTMQNRRAYDRGLQARSIGTLLTKTAVKVCKEGALSEENDSVLKNIVMLAVDSFCSGEVQWHASCSQLLVYLQRISLTGKDNSEVAQALSANGRLIITRVIDIFAKCPLKPTAEQAKQLCGNVELLRFYFQNATKFDWFGEAVPAELRTSLINQVYLILNTETYDPASLQLKASAITIFTDILRMCRVTKSSRDLDDTAVELISSGRVSVSLTTDELYQVAHIIDKLINMMTLHASAMVSFASREPHRLSRLAGSAIALYFASVPLKQGVFLKKFKHILAQLSYEEPEGRKAVAHCLSKMVSSLNPQVFMKWVALPLWLKIGIRMCACVQEGEEDEMTELSKLAGRVLGTMANIGPGNVRDLIPTTITNLKELAQLAPLLLLLAEFVKHQLKILTISDIRKVLYVSRGAYQLCSRKPKGGFKTSRAGVSIPVLDKEEEQEDPKARAIAEIYRAIASYPDEIQEEYVLYDKEAKQLHNDLSDMMAECINDFIDNSK